MESNSKWQCGETKENQNNIYFTDEKLLIIVATSGSSLIWKATNSKQSFFHSRLYFAGPQRGYGITLVFCLQNFIQHRNDQCIEKNNKGICLCFLIS